MYLTAKPGRLVTILSSVALLTACGDDTEAADHGPFCEPMEEATILLEPHTGSTTPDGTRARYDKVSSVLDAAQQAAPTAIAADVAGFAAAINRFASALATVDYDIDALYNTPDGVQLAEDTSHALTPAIVEHLTGPCGLTVG